MDHSLQDVCERYRRLYTGAIADILDKKGHRHQVLPYDVTPFTQNDRVAGPAFTGQGYPAARPTSRRYANAARHARQH